MKKHTMKEWILATRPWAYPASAMPVMVTLAYLFWRGEEMNWVNGIWALLNIVVFHASGNTWSDYFDYKHKVDDKDTYGVKTLTEGIFEPKQIYRLALGLLTVAIVAGALLAWRTGWPLLLIGIGGVLCALLYPPLKFRAWGDAVIFVCYAILPTIGTAYATTGGIPPESLLVTLPSGLITVAILHANNTRDIATDHRAGIRTFAMNMGRRMSVVVYLLEVLLPYLIVPVCAAVGVLPWWSMLSVLALPMSVGNSRVALRSLKEGAKALSRLDEMTSKLQLTFNLLLSIALVLAALI